MINAGDNGLSVNFLVNSLIAGINEPEMADKPKDIPIVDTLQVLDVWGTLIAGNVEQTTLANIANIK